VQHFGWVKNENSALCLDTLQQDEKEAIKLGVFSCQGSSSAQFFSLANDGALRREITCSVVRLKLDKQRGNVVMPNCGNINEKWVYDNKVSFDVRV
jgi:hypothetical protein